jgi:hypothetical protein
MISQDIRKRAGFLGALRGRNEQWYTNELLNELQGYQKRNYNQADTYFITPGDLIFFMYSAKFPQKYKFWDQHPLVYVMEVRPSEGLFFGANLHYLNPSYRGGYAKSLLNKEGKGIAPRKTLKNYLFANVMSDLYKVPDDDWEGVSLLPTERFVDKKGRRISNQVPWDYPDSLSTV